MWVFDAVAYLRNAIKTSEDIVSNLPMGVFNVECVHIGTSTCTTVRRRCYACRRGVAILCRAEASCKGPRVVGCASDYVAGMV